MPSYRATKLVPPIWFLVALIAMAMLHNAIPLARIFPPPWRWVGLLPLIGGVTLALTAGRLFGQRGTGVVPFSPVTTLVTTGPYRFTRNPMYVGLVLTLAGAAILFGTVTPWLAIPPFAWWIDRRFIRQEEIMLEEHFGADYVAFKQRVRRWI